MTINLEPKEAEGLFHAALCNGASYLAGYGLKLDYDQEYRDRAKAAWKLSTPDRTMCLEDVWLGILKEGGTLKFIDEGYDGRYSKDIVLKDVHDRVQLTPHNHLMDMINDKDDAITADCILQTVIFEKVVFS
jgi:hypothetical protein